MSGIIKKIVPAYLLITFTLCWFIFPAHDTFYYWTWSQHLQLSYVDGPPLMAYLLWVTTHLFGNNFFAIALVSYLALLASSYLVARISLELDGKRDVAKLAGICWLVYPFITTRFVLINTTLDCLEVTFSLLIILNVLRLIKAPRPLNYYYLGLSVGCGLLAKYNVIILVAALIIFFALKPQLRFVYASRHLYLAAFLAIALFLPVLVWNYQHAWQSFSYQLHVHDWNGPPGSINSADKYGLPGTWFYIKDSLLGVLHILLVGYLWLRYLGRKQGVTNGIGRQLLEFCLWFILLFWLYQSYKAHVGLNYMVSAGALLMVIIIQPLVSSPVQKYLPYIILICALISVGMQIDKTRVKPRDQDNYQKYVKSGLVKSFINKP